MNPLSYVGTLAAFCTTTSFIPQIVKIKKQGADDLSYSMLFLYLTGVLLWLVYGLLLHAAAIIWANAITSFLVALALALKATSRPLREIAGPDDDSLVETE
ncbi:MAG TPA: PQ-loop repeat-containing protein [Candidatus Binatus sp.]|jgi:MtN3 and saliva related transmembrane protein|nr:PQ-loop repeat-containing protein [Candidatus Binatus sp.]